MCVLRLTKYFEAEKVSGTGTFIGGRWWSMLTMWMNAHVIWCTLLHTQNYANTWCNPFSMISHRILVLVILAIVLIFAKFLSLACFSLSQSCCCWCICMCWKFQALTKRENLPNVRSTIWNLIISRQKCFGVCLCRFYTRKVTLCTLHVAMSSTHAYGFCYE